MSSNTKALILIGILIVAGFWLFTRVGGTPEPPASTTVQYNTDPDSGDLLDDYFGPQDTADGTVPGADPGLVDWDQANTIDEVTDLAKVGMNDIAGLGKYALQQQRGVAETGYIAMTSIAMSADLSQTMIAVAPWAGIAIVALLIMALSKNKSKDNPPAPIEKEPPK